MNRYRFIPPDGFLHFRVSGLRRFSTLLLFFLIIPCTVISCALKDRYTYSRIKAEYEKPGPLPVTEGAVTEPRTVRRSVTGPLSLDRTIRIALDHNPDVDAAVARIRQSEAMIDEAMAAFWPVVSVYGEYVQGNSPSAFLFKTIDQRQLQPGTDFNQPGWFENMEVGVRTRWNLFNGGRDWLQKRMAETGLEIRELDRRSVENGLVTSVIHAYFNALAAREFVSIARQSVETVQAQLRVMKVRYEAGGALKSDVLSLEVRLAQAKEDLIRAENTHSLSLSSLATLLDLEPDAPLILNGKAELPADMAGDYRSGLLFALAHRPELKKARLRIIQSKMALDRARSEFLPRLDAEGRVYMDDPDGDFDTGRKNWSAGVMMNWDLFTGMSTKSRADKARAVLEEMLAVDKKTVRSTQLDLKTAYLKLAEACARLNVTRASVAQAEESLRLVMKQVEGGSATITRYLDAELAQNRMRMRAAAAFYDREKARAAVGRALGYWAQYVKEVPSRHE